MIPTVLQVALGGALGAAARYGVTLALARSEGLPIAVLTANILGSFLIGAVYVLATERGLAPGLSPFLVTGLLGGFTTFSAFSLETLALVERGQPGLAVLYIALSVAGSLAAVALGLWLMRSLA